MDEWDDHSTSTESQRPNRGVQYLEDGTVREYVDHGGNDHQRYIWRRAHTDWGYSWYKEQHWDDGWYEGTHGDGAGLHVNDKGTEMPQAWETLEGRQFGYLDAPEDGWAE